HRPLDGPDVHDVSASATGHLARGRLWRAQGMVSRAPKEGPARAEGAGSRGREIPSVPHDRRVVLLARRGYGPARLEARPEDPAAPLASVLSAQLLDRLVGHGRPAVSIEKGPRQTPGIVVLQRPHARREIILGIAQP